MFQELAQIYPGPFLHLGADETQELGRGQTKAEVDSRGLGAVYLDFMQKIVADLQPLNRKLLFWGDIAEGSPQLVKSLPKDMVAVAWDYWSFARFDRKIRLPNVGRHSAAALDRIAERGELVFEQHHIGNASRRLDSRASKGDADVGGA